MNSILEVETPFARVVISGPHDPKAVLLDQSAWPIPRIEVATTSPFTTQRRFPFLFEEENYQILAQSKIPGKDISVRHRDMRTLQNVHRIPHVEPSTTMGLIRFSQSVGLSTFSFDVDNESLELTLEVFPVKLDYLDDYDAMVEDVQSFDRVLPLRFFEATYRKADIDREQVGDNLEWLAILRSQIGDLCRAMRYADKHPLISLEQRIGLVRSSHVRDMTQQVRRSVSRGLGSGSWECTLSGIPIRRQIFAEQPQDSLDSVEHRWLRENIKVILNLLTHIIQNLHIERDRRNAQYGISHRFRIGTALEQQVEEVEELREQLGALERLSIVKNASIAHVPSSFSSLRLIRKPGYSEAYRVITALRLGLQNIEGGVDISTTRLGSLYEAWCFIEVLRQIEELTNGSVLEGAKNFVEDSTLGTRLVRGRSSEAEFSLPDGRHLMVRYNRSYYGLTGVHVPDIELVFSKNNAADLVVLFDAKYRLDNSHEQVAFYGMPAPPQDAIGALHRYRDAIVTDGNNGTRALVRPVVMGVALYPLSRSASTNFNNSKLSLALQRYGIGAIPFLPGNTGYLKEWLSAILQLPHELLGKVGPLRPEDRPS